MKALTTIAILLCLAVITLIGTKPTDQECINRVRNNPQYSGIDAVLNNLAANRYTVTIEDHIFYKSIYSRLDGQQLGTGIFGTVILKQ